MYGDHFGLAELPFSVNPDPRFSYSNTLYREAFATLRYGIETRKGFIVITGEAGTGKTTLLRRLMRSVEATVHTAFIFNTHLSFTELLRLVLSDLEIVCSTDDKLTMIARLNDYLIEQLQRDHIVSLLVDEAQDLSNEMLEELRLLSNLETDRAKLIQIVLMGQPELERKLDQPELRQLKQRVAIRCRLAPLRSEEVASYINSRLQTVGYKGKELFDLASIQEIALYSKGIPRLINVICDNALLIAYATSKSKVSAKIIDEVARDLQLVAAPTPEKPREDSSVAQANAQPDDEHWAGVARFPAAVAPRSGQLLRHRRSMTGVGIGVLLGVVILVGTILYSQQSGSFAAFGVNIEELVGARWNNRIQAPQGVAQDKLVPLPIPNVQMTASRTAEFLIGNPGQDGTTVPPNKESRKSPTSAREDDGPPDQVLAEESNKQAQPDTKNKTKERSPFSGTLKVFDTSFVRDKPRSDANITGMLEPGTRVKIQSKTGDYFRVRSLDKEPITGYVHREDAFFEPAK